jgi:hypothetical protein
MPGASLEPHKEETSPHRASLFPSMVLAAQQSCKSYQQRKQRHRYKQGLFRHGAPFGPRGSPTSGQGLIADRLPVAHLLNNIAFAMRCDSKGSPKRGPRTTLAVMPG